MDGETDTEVPVADAQPPLLRLAPAAEYLGGMSERTLRNLAAKGQIEMVNVGRGRRITRKSLDAYIARQREEAAARLKKLRNLSAGRSR
jgi:excisionase family DNA binding protein